jgi:hypothetical protein
MDKQEKIEKQDKTEKTTEKSEKKQTKQKQQPKKQNKPKITPFDLATWVREHGNLHLQKSSPFDHTTHKMISHVCFDKDAGYYHTINTYKYPDGTLALGKTNRGGNKYALKGKAMMVPSKDKKQKIVQRGKRTFEEKYQEFTKKGYKEVQVHAPAHAHTTAAAST